MTRNRILIIDDSETIRVTLKLTLEFKGYAVSEAADGQEGLDALRSREFDLVFCDLAMPGIQGIDLIRMARTELGLKDIPIVILSAEEREAKKLAMDAGATEWVDKPFSAQQIIELTERLLSAR